MMQRDRQREGLRIRRATWLVGVTVREYREMEAGDRVPEFDVWDRLCDLYGWPQTFVRAEGDRHAKWRSVNAKP